MPRLAQLCGVFLVSAAGLLFQFAQTRLFSATLGYHLSFLALAVGFTGLGAVAVVCYGLAALSTADVIRFRIRGDARADLSATTS